MGLHVFLVFSLAAPIVGRIFVVQAILPAAGFQPAVKRQQSRVSLSFRSRLKAGCSHDWLPHAGMTDDKKAIVLSHAATDILVCVGFGNLNLD
jgi:hypothetical protein